MDARSLIFPHDRRRFIKHFALSTAASMVGGKLWSARLLADVGHGLPNNRIDIKLSDYPALQSIYGSVRFQFMSLDGIYYPFALNRADETTFYAVDTRCTHMGCMVNGFNLTEPPTYSMLCDCHYSEYTISGQRIDGPAAGDLYQHMVSYDGLDTVTVFIPGLDLAIRSVTAQEKTATTIRVRLDFPTMLHGRYKVLFRQNLDDEPLGVLFSTTPSGPATLDQLEADGTMQTVYVDAALPRGFFSVALVVDVI